MIYMFKSFEALKQSLVRKPIIFPWLDEVFINRSEEAVGTGGCPAGVVPCGQEVGGLRRQLAKASSLILLQDDTP